MDPNAVALLTPKWTREIMTDARREPLFTVVAEKGGFTCLLSLPTNTGNPFILPFPIRMGIMQGEKEGNGWRMKAWGVSKLGVGTWRLDPSIHQPGVIHAFVVLCEVPDQAPWEITNG